MTKLLLLGATGYIGGQVLHELLQSNKDLEITAVARTQKKADALPKQVKTLIGCNEDYDVLRDASADADIVVHIAESADDLSGPPAIAEGLGKRQNGGWYIHHSGTGVLSEWSYGEAPKAKVFHDETGIDDIHKIPDDQPHRKIDKLVFGVEEKYPHVKTVIVCPPTINGISKSTGNPITIQIPGRIKTALSLKHGFSVGPGDNRWAEVNVVDLGRFFSLLITTMLKDPSKVAHGHDGYYFVENGEYRIGDIDAAIAKSLKKKGLLASDELLPFTKEDAIKLSGSDDIRAYMGTSSRCVAERARKLGWQPKEPRVMETLAEELDYVLANMKTSA